MLLARGVLPTEIEDMSVERLSFWLDVCDRITAAEEEAAKRRA